MAIQELRISRKDLDLIQADMVSNKPYEACGVLIGTITSNTAKVEKTCPVTNVLRTPRSFELDPVQFYHAWKDADTNGKEIVGVYHTHPLSCALPSQWDRETMENDMSVWVIAGVDGIRAYVWENGLNTVRITECVIDQRDLQLKCERLLDRKINS